MPPAPSRAAMRYPATVDGSSARSGSNTSVALFIGLPDPLVNRRADQRTP